MGKIYESEWGYTALTPSALTSEKGIHILPSQPDSDNSQYSVGSKSLASDTVAECLNINQGTAEWWIDPQWDGDDGKIHRFFRCRYDGENRIRISKRANSNLCYIYEGANVMDTGGVDVSAWAAGTWRHIVLVWDVNNVTNGTDNITLYVNGSRAAGTTSITLLIALPSAFDIGGEEGSNVLNGLIYGRILNRPLSAAEVSDLYASGAGHLDSTVVTPDTLWLPKFSDDLTGCIFWPSGQGVTATTSVGVVTVDITDIEDRSYNDGDRVQISDGTGFATSGDCLINDSPSTSTANVHSGEAYADINGTSQYFYRTDADFPESGIIGAHDFTIQAWIKPDTLSGNHCVASKYRGSGSKKMYRFRQVDDELDIAISSDGSSETVKQTAGVNLTVNVWTHIAVVYDASAGTADFYKNGIFVEQETGLLNSIADKDPNFVVGQVDNGNAPFSGGLSNVVLFNDKRTAAEIRASAADWDIDLSGEGNIIGQWMFNDAAAAAFIDNTQGDAGRDLIPYDGGNVTFDTLRSVDGGYVQDVELVGQSLNCASTYYTQGGDILDITTEDFEIDFWMRQDGDPGGDRYVIGKGSAVAAANSWIIYMSSNGRIYLRAYDGTNDGYFYYDATAYHDDKWHHYHFYADRSAIATCTIYIDGAAVTPVTSGTFPVNTLTNGSGYTVGAKADGSLITEGYLRDVTIHIGGTMRTAAQILYRATHPFDYSANGWTEDGTREAWPLNEGSGTTNYAQVTPTTNDLTLSNAAAWSQEAFLSKNLLVDGGMESGGIGAWEIQGTPTTVDKETDTDSDTQSLHILSAADNDGVSQTIAATSGDKFYLYQRHKVTAGSFEVNVTNGGGGIETGISDASWTALEKIISATGNLTFQWLAEAAADDFNISKATLQKCVAGDSLAANKYYTLVYNVDTTTTGAAWSGLGSDATEVKAGDLYVQLDEADASTATKGSGHIPLGNPIYIA